MNDLTDSGVNIGNSVHDGFSQVFSYIPQIIAAIVILIIGYFVARGLAAVMQKALRRLKFDEHVLGSSAGKFLERVISSPSGFVGRAVYWLVFVAFISFAVSALNLPLLNQILYGVYAYLPKVIAAIAIFLVASAVAGGSAAFVVRVMGSTPLAKLISGIIPAVVMSLAFFMILNELQIATDIVNILFTALVGSLALGFALAFGLGGRDVAGKMLAQAYESGRRNAAGAKAEVKQAARNAKTDAANLRDRAE